MTCEFNEAEFVATCARVTNRMSIGTINAVGSSIAEAVADGRAHHSFKNQSGALEKSIHGEVTSIIGSGRGAEGFVAADAEHASFVEDDTRAHVIRPKADAGTVGPLDEGQSKLSRAETKAIKQRNRVRGAGYTTGTRMLSWMGKDGYRHFARVVHHPGTKGQPFMGPMFLKCERVCERDIVASVPAAQAEIDR